MNHKRRLLLVLGAALLPAAAAENYSSAEQALFMRDHLGSLKPPLTLHYHYRKSGTLEPGFDDRVSIVLARAAEGGCCAASTTFLQGTRHLSLPDIEAAKGNPVILYFLERDVREMSRLTKGQAAYFRKRIRMAAYQGATVEAARVQHGGKNVAAQRITLAPYVDDPLRARFNKLERKRYVFTLSPNVPGQVASIVAEVDGAGGDAPLLAEALWLDGTAPPAAAR
jgi:hypothetical protein